jgi:murein DD-endopeptidase MepM/ murein hydrolase activator NlpD
VLRQRFLGVGEAIQGSAQRYMSIRPGRACLIFILLVSLAACQQPSVPSRVTSTVIAADSQPTRTPSRKSTQAPSVVLPVPTPTDPIILTPAPAPVIQLCSPLAETSLSELPEIVSKPFEPPPPHHEEGHHGVDLAYYRKGNRASILGEGVQSVFNGRVAAAIQDRFPYGNMVIIETPDEAMPEELVKRLGMASGESLYTLYAHMLAAPQVTLGESITACQGLGQVGKSGNAAVAHLHLEMRIGPAARQFPGMAYYFTHATAEERENYVLWRTSGTFRMIDPMSVLLQGE